MELLRLRPQIGLWWITPTKENPSKIMHDPIQPAQRMEHTAPMRLHSPQLQRVRMPNILCRTHQRRQRPIGNLNRGHLTECEGLESGPGKSQSVFTRHLADYWERSLRGDVKQAPYCVVYYPVVDSGARNGVLF